MTLTRNLDARDVLNQIVNDPRYAEVMRVPVFSGPQILLASVALALFGFSTAAAIAHTIPLWLAMVCNLISVYLAFTPLHDASHRAVSSNSFLNDLIGIIPGQLLLPGINMTAFRAIHMDHHRYVGQEGRDPDTAFVRLPFGGVFYLMFADIHWVFWYLEYGRHYWSRKVAFYMVLLLVMVIGIHAAFLMSPWWKEFLLLYVVPQRIGLGVVAYTFAHIQHPEGLTWENEPFQSTMFVGGNSPFRRLMFGQEEHIIHHLTPHVPWFKYKRVWDLANGALRRQGVPERSWLHAPEVIEVPTAESRAPVPMRVAAIQDEASDIRVLRLEAVGGGSLRPGEVGGHVDLHLPGGLVRQYSLVEADAQHYTIAVKRDDKGRGGSLAVHRLAVGDEIAVGKPRNNFVLYETAPSFVLVAGGVGITALLPMARRLATLGKPFAFHVCARNEAALPFRAALTSAPLAGHVGLHFDKADGTSSLDPLQALAKPTPGTLLYLCGPQGFMDWLRGAAIAAGWDQSQIRLENFAAPVLEDGEQRPFSVELSRSQRSVPVRADESIIDALARIGIDVPFACMQGTCGTCIAPVSGGAVDHRDAFLSREEKAEGDKMCLCVSRARDESITLDL